MPLQRGMSKAAFQANIRAEVDAGKPVKQAVAIAYAQQRRHADGGRVLPDEGNRVLSGQVRLTGPATGIRPFNPGEYLANPDGSWSNEVTATVQDPALNGGRVTVVPTLWLVRGRPVRVPEDLAARYAASSGLAFPSFDDQASAEAFTNQREGRWQTTQPGDASVPALWQPSKGYADGGSVFSQLRDWLRGEWRANRGPNELTMAPNGEVAVPSAGLGSTLTTAGEAMDLPFRAVGDATYDLTGSPLAATAAYTASGMLAPSQVARGARAVGSGVKALVEHAPVMAQRLADRLGPLGQLASPMIYIVKPKGGNWLQYEMLRDGSQLTPPPGGYPKTSGLGVDVSQALGLGFDRPEETDWIDKNFRRYLMTHFGSADDPLSDYLVQKAREGRFASPWFEPFEVQDDLNHFMHHRGRSFHGPAELNPNGRDPRDFFTGPHIKTFRPNTTTIRDINDYKYHVLDRLYFDTNLKTPDWVSSKAGKEPLYDTVTDMNRSLAGNLENELMQVRDYMRTLPPDRAKNISVPDMFRQADQWHQQLAAKQAQEAILNQKGIRVHKEYPSGFKWVEVGAPPESPLTELPEGYRVQRHKDGRYMVLDENGMKLKDPDQRAYNEGEIFTKTPEEAKDKALRLINYFDAEEALNNEGKMMGHCVGSYCDEVRQGDSKIYSLRDPKGMSHVTIEVNPASRSLKKASRDEIANHFGITTDFIPEDGGYLVSEPDGSIKSWVPLDFDPRKYHGLSTDIAQIKGKQNRAPVADYLPYVHDFVKSGSWGDVRDLHGTGLVDLHSRTDALPWQGLSYDDVTAMKDRFGPDLANVFRTRSGQRFLTPDEFNDLTMQLLGEAKGTPGYAQGGSVKSTYDRLLPTFHEIEQQLDLPKGLLYAVSRPESNGNPKAVSPKGARGLFQLMPLTARRFNVTDPHDPVEAAWGAGKYLRVLLDQFKSLPEALAAYNWGEGNVARHGLAGAPKETREFVPKVLRLMDLEAPKVMKPATTVTLPPLSDAEDTEPAPHGRDRAALVLLTSLLDDNEDDDKVI